MDDVLRPIYSDLVHRVNVNRGSFVEILQGSLGPDDGEHFRYGLNGPRERMRYVLDQSHREPVWKALRLGLLLHGYTDVLELVNERLPPPEPEENPASWRLPLTSIRRYLLADVKPCKGGLASILADSLPALGDERPEPARLLELALDSLDRPAVLYALRRGLRESGHGVEAEAVERALDQENRYTGRGRRLPDVCADAVRSDI